MPSFLDKMALGGSSADKSNATATSIRAGLLFAKGTSLPLKKPGEFYSQIDMQPRARERLKARFDVGRRFAKVVGEFILSEARSGKYGNKEYLDKFDAGSFRAGSSASSSIFKSRMAFNRMTLRVSGVYFGAISGFTMGRAGILGAEAWGTAWWDTALIAGGIVGGGWLAISEIGSRLDQEVIEEVYRAYAVGAALGSAYETAEAAKRKIARKLKGMYERATAPWEHLGKGDGRGVFGTWGM